MDDDREKSQWRMECERHGMHSTTWLRCIICIRADDAADEADGDAAAAEADGDAAAATTEQPALHCITLHDMA